MSRIARSKRKPYPNPNSTVERNCNRIPPPSETQCLMDDAVAWIGEQPDAGLRDLFISCAFDIPIFLSILKEAKNV